MGVKDLGEVDGAHDVAVGQNHIVLVAALEDGQGGVEGFQLAAIDAGVAVA